MVKFSKGYCKRFWSYRCFIQINSIPMTTLSKILFPCHVCLSIRLSVRPFVRVSKKLAPFPAVAWQNVTNKSCLVCVKSEKYASWVTLRPQWDCCCRGEAEVRTLDFKTTLSKFQMPSQTAAVQGKAEPHILDFKTIWTEFQKSIQIAAEQGKAKLRILDQSSRCQVRLLQPRRSRGVYTQF